MLSREQPFERTWVPPQPVQSESQSTEPIAPDAVDAVRMSVERILGDSVTKAPRFRSTDDFSRYWQAITNRAHVDDLAIRIAEELPVGAFGLTSYAFASAPSFRRALQILVRDSMRAVPGFLATLSDRAGVTELRFAGPDVLRPIKEMLLALMTMRARQLPLQPIEIVAAMFTRQAPRELTRWNIVFGHPRFGAPCDAIRFTSADLERPMRTSNAEVQRALGPVAKVASLADHVRAHIQVLRRGVVADRVAAALGMSPRRLQRRLHEEGMSFRDLATELRVHLAAQLLSAHRDIALSEIAAQVGFASAAVLSRAFRKLHGMTPSRWRARGGASGSQIGGKRV